jgi:hypothetical protein
VANSRLPRFVIVSALLAQTACAGDFGSVFVPPAETSKVDDSLADSILDSADGLSSWPPVLTRHAIVPAVIPSADQASEAVRLARASTFSYEAEAWLRDKESQDLAIHLHTPLSSPSVSTTERYRLSFDAEGLVLDRLEGTRPMSQVKLAVSLDDSPFGEAIAQPVSDTRNKLALAWDETSPLALKIQVDDLTLAVTDGVKLSLGGITMADAAIPVLTPASTFRIEGLSSGPRSLEAHLETFLEAALGHGPAYQGRMSVDSVHSGMTLPVLLVPSLPLGKDQRAEVAKSISQSLRTWYQNTQPVVSEFRFNLTVHGSETASTPLLTISGATLPVTAITDL